ncbi:hypothetical protein [Vagococcus fluvialis]|uniref:hypothetical protein n=1 Tax=Vagococcus fluvialis TaxID=2738 RepID=UPI001A8C0633|nr:hypothetical protein [Vagococcus fluvialis]MBO0485950.1 hypothetical protein [Vagococcus fluvialis]UDM72436.1 hypothetical protein K5L00_06900 [Vagococcus fluvialis]UDM77301.1 hypothetical protein K5K98_02440 [Vagococcus fluvialis]UDM81571.1 hypothetical protein K5K96_09375 [Vagococcus fluvialis]
MKFYVAKLNVNGNIFVDPIDLDNIIEKKIPNHLLKFKSESDLDLSYIDKLDGSKWGLYDVKEINGQERIIYGNLVRTVEMERNLLDDNVLTEDKVPFSYFSKFFYVVEKEYLIFQSTTNINYEDFLIYFKKMMEFDNGISEIGEIELILLTKTDEIEDILLKKLITKLDFYFVQPNNRRNFNKIQDIFNESNSKKGNVTLENSEGLKTTEGTDKDKLTDNVKEIVELTNNGYGSINMSYKNNREDKKVINISSENYKITDSTSEKQLETESGMIEFINKFIRKM